VPSGDFQGSGSEAVSVLVGRLGRRLRAEATRQQRDIGGVEPAAG
jgi:hypothetical protein